MLNRRKAEAERKVPMRDRQVKDLAVVRWLSHRSGDSVVFFLFFGIGAAAFSFDGWYNLTYVDAQWDPLIPLLITLVVLLYASGVSAARAIEPDRLVRYRVGRIIFPMGVLATVAFGVVQTLGIVPVHRTTAAEPALPGEAATLVAASSFRATYDVSVDAIVELPFKASTLDDAPEGRCWEVQGSAAITRVAPKGAMAGHGLSGPPWRAAGVETHDGFMGEVQLLRHGQGSCAITEGKPNLLDFEGFGPGQQREFDQAIWVPDGSTPVIFYFMDGLGRIASWELAPGDCAERESSTIDLYPIETSYYSDRHGCMAVRDFNDQRGILQLQQKEVTGVNPDYEDVLLPWEGPAE